MKKMLIGATAAALLVISGIGGVWAAESVNPNVTNEQTFKEMLPFMKKMHPNVSDENFKEMYNDCHSDRGMKGWHGTKNMKE